MNRFLLTAALALSISAAAQAATVTETVDARASIHGAGLPPAGNPSLAPVSIDLSGATGTFLTVSASGSADCCNGTPDVDVDGLRFDLSSPGNTNVSALGGISGVSATGRNLFLSGVFIDSGAAVGPAPVSLSYLNDAAYTETSYAPLLNQAFFIGDGLTGTGSGVAQQFVRPTGADTLLLGFIDGFGFNSAPSYFGDNRGSAVATVDLNPAAVPLPAGLPLLLGGLAGIVVLRRRG